MVLCNARWLLLSRYVQRKSDLGQLRYRDTVKSEFMCRIMCVCHVNVHVFANTKKKPLSERRKLIPFEGKQLISLS
jgi:hypothetical protein